MDPLTILSVAAAVIQFVDFGGRLISKSIALYRGIDGNQERIVDLRQIYFELQQLSNAINEKTARLIEVRGSLGAAESAVLEQSTRAHVLCDDILDLIDGMGKQGVEKVDFGAEKEGVWGSSRHSDQQRKGKLESFRSAAMAALKRKVKSKTSEGKLEQLEKSLQQIKTDLMLAMMARLWDESISVEISKHTSGSSPGRTPPALLQRFGSNLEESSHTDILRSLFNQHQVVESASIPIREIHTGRIQGGVWVEMSDAECLSAILKTLDDPTLHHREVDIPKAYAHTFRWIFDAPLSDPLQPGKHLWDDYTQWLKSPSDKLYWITGKPGSGKSTMMKFITKHPQTPAYLQAWSGPLPIITLTFYSWNAGSELQKSPEGLLRTLLYQIISKRPSLAPQLLPDRWAMIRLFGDDHVEQLPSWTCEELLATLSSVTRREFAGTKYSLAIFIDGLDEFNKVDDGHQHLLNLIRDFQELPNIKICVSSRPWTAFNDAFRHRSQLRMEKITEHDISLFVHGKLEENDGFKELNHDSPSQAETLVNTLVEKAEGVFLWVAVVTKAVLDGLSDGDRVGELEALLEDIPSDLMKLYSRLWQRIKPERKNDGAKLVLLFHTYMQTPQIRMITEEVYNKGRRIKNYPRVNKPKMSPLTLWAADADVWGDQGNRLPQESYIIANLTRRLDSRTRGLLTIKRYDEIDYVHRTAQDWVQNTLLPQIRLDLPPDFDPHLNLLKSSVSDITQTSCWFTGTNYGTSLGRALELPEIYIDTWRQLTHCFYHICRLRNHSVNYPQIIQVVDELEKRLRSAIDGKEMRELRPVWMRETALSGGTRRGFVALAARMGAGAYVLAKVSSDPAYYLSLQPEQRRGRKGEYIDPEYDILSSLALGTGHPVSGREYKMALKVLQKDEIVLFHKLLAAMNGCYLLRTGNDDLLRPSRYEALKELLCVLNRHLSSPPDSDVVSVATKERARRHLEKIYSEFERGLPAHQGKKGHGNVYQYYYDKEIVIQDDGVQRATEGEENGLPVSAIRGSRHDTRLSMVGSGGKVKYRLAVMDLLKKSGVTGRSSTLAARVAAAIKLSGPGGGLLAQTHSREYERWLRGETI